jgi:hypothetical protein
MYGQNGTKFGQYQRVDFIKSFKLYCQILSRGLLKIALISSILQQQNKAKGSFMLKKPFF